MIPAYDGFLDDEYDPCCDDNWENAWGEQMERHEAAARALHSQPFGFTREDVIRCHIAAQYVVNNGGTPEAAQCLIDLADRIEALLPLEEV